MAPHPLSELQGTEGVKEGLLSVGWGRGQRLNAPRSLSVQRVTFCLEPASVPWNSDVGLLMPMETGLWSPGVGPRVSYTCTRKEPAQELPGGLSSNPNLSFVSQMAFIPSSGKLIEAMFSVK